MRTRFNRDTGKWEEVVVQPLSQRPKRLTPFVIKDGHTPFRSMADGKMYDSKSVYRRTLKEKGFVEVGNETNWASKPNKLPPVADSINEAMNQLGYH